MGLVVQQIAVQGYDDNFSYLIYDEESKVAAYVDPCGEWERARNVASELALTIQMIVVTHTHHDHIDALKDVHKYVLMHVPKAPVYGHELGVARLTAVAGEETALPFPSPLKIGPYVIDVFDTPGHSDDSVCLYIPATQSQNNCPQLLTGDTLFVAGCGRTNEHGVEALYDSLQFIKTLPPETIIYPGHDYGPAPTSHLAHERTYNRFLQAPDLATFRQLRLG